MKKKLCLLLLFVVTLFLGVGKVNASTDYVEAYVDLINESIEADIKFSSKFGEETTTVEYIDESKKIIMKDSSGEIVFDNINYNAEDNYISFIDYDSSLAIKNITNAFPLMHCYAFMYSDDLDTINEIFSNSDDYTIYSFFEEYTYDTAGITFTLDENGRISEFRLKLDRTFAEALSEKFGLELKQIEEPEEPTDPEKPEEPEEPEEPTTSSTKASTSSSTSKETNPGTKDIKVRSMLSMFVLTVLFILVALKKLNIIKFKKKG